MIRINRSSVNIPISLAGSDSLGTRETEKALEFFSNNANRKRTFPFKIYKRKDVKVALEELFHGKCAYCESKYLATQPVEVEHYRPKGAVVIEGQLCKPGYYWLAASWNNLLPSCIDCNRRRTQQFPDCPPGLAGKANLFPIASEKTRARQPGQEKQERRLLLDPCRDNPKAHLEFLENGLVLARKKRRRHSRKGLVSIEVYGLCRRGLVQMRRDRIWRILAQIKRVRRAIRRIEKEPDNAVWEDDLKAELEELHLLQDSSQPYAGMARQIIHRYIPLPKRHDGV